MNIHVKTAGIVVLGIILSACAPKNPLSNPSAIEDLRDYFVWDGFTNPSLSDCTHYFAKLQTPPEKLGSACHKLLREEYDMAKKNNAGILKRASFEQFSDPEVWKMLVGTSK